LKLDPFSRHLFRVPRPGGSVVLSRVHCRNIGVTRDDVSGSTRTPGRSRQYRCICQRGSRYRKPSSYSKNDASRRAITIKIPRAKRDICGGDRGSGAAKCGHAAGDEAVDRDRGSARRRFGFRRGLMPRHCSRLWRGMARPSRIPPLRPRLPSLSWP
jgi:hypothetical protein